MTVAELIAQLQTLDQNLLVVRARPDGTYRGFDGWYPHLLDLEYLHGDIYGPHRFDKPIEAVEM